MSTKLKTLRDEQATLFAQLRESAANGDREAVERINSELSEIEVKIVAELEAAEAASIQAEAVEASRLEPLKVAPHGSIVEEGNSYQERYEDAFMAWMRRGKEGLTPSQREVLFQEAHENPYGLGQRSIAAPTGESRADLGVGSGAIGGFTVPEGFVAQITAAQRAFGGLRRSNRVNNITTDSGNPLPFPTGDDTGNVGAIVNENTTVGEQDTAFGQVILGAHIFTSRMVKVSRALLQDTGVDLVGYLSGILGERIGRAQAPFLISGTGTGQPEGAVTNAAVGHTTGVGAPAITYADLVTLEHSVDTAYREQAEYVVSDDALRTIRLLEDNDGRPLWVPAVSSMAQGVPATINGYPYIVDQSMGAVDNDEKPVLFGDLSFYVIRDVTGVILQRLDERFAELLQVAFLAFQRMDAKPVNPGNAWKVMQIGAAT